MRWFITNKICFCYCDNTITTTVAITVPNAIIISRWKCNNWGGIKSCKLTCRSSILYPTRGIKDREVFFLSDRETFSPAAGISGFDLEVLKDGAWKPPTTLSGFLLAKLETIFARTRLESLVRDDEFDCANANCPEMLTRIKRSKTTVNNAINNIGIMLVRAYS